MTTIQDYEIKTDHLVELIKSGKWDEVSQKANGIQEALGISDDALIKYYEVASGLLRDRNWTDSRDAFMFLTFLNPFVHNFWMGLGISEQSQGKFEAALLAYLMGEMTDPKDPVVHANSFQCYLALGDTVSAAMSYQIALDSCDAKEGSEELKNNLINYRRQLLSGNEGR